MGEERTVNQRKVHCVATELSVFYGGLGACKSIPVWVMLKDYFNSDRAPEQKNPLWPLSPDSPVCQSNVKHVWNGRKDFEARIVLVMSITESDFEASSRSHLL